MDGKYVLVSKHAFNRYLLFSNLQEAFQFLFCIGLRLEYWHGQEFETFCQMLLQILRK